GGHRLARARAVPVLARRAAAEAQFPYAQRDDVWIRAATVVVEAGEHSGAHAQARMAVEHGRPVILADLVVDRTEWARALVGRPGVHVARSLRGCWESLTS
ncbi:MAG: hypothetical protein ACRDNZ_22440, partial [Streptosporangiaceae bacterium]